MTNSLMAWSRSQRPRIWWSHSFEKTGASELTGCHLGSLVSLTDRKRKQEVSAKKRSQEVHPGSCSPVWEGWVRPIPPKAGSHYPRSKQGPGVAKMLSFYLFIFLHRGFPGSSAGKESACNAGDPSLIPGSGRSAGEEISYPVQYS